MTLLDQKLNTMPVGKPAAVLGVDAAGLPVLSPTQAVTPDMFGAIGDGVSDDTQALKDWAASGMPLCMPGKTYKVTNYVVIDLNRSSLIAAGAAKVVQFNAVPTLILCGSRATAVLPRVEYNTQALATDYSAVGIVFSTRSDGSGFYWSTCDRLVVDKAAVGIFEHPAIASTLAIDAPAGASTITVADPQDSPYDGIHPWLPGMRIQILRDNGSTTTTRIASVVGAVLGLEDPVGSDAAVGRPVTVGSANTFSNEFLFTKTFNCPLGHIILRAGTTQNRWNYVHMHNNDLAPEVSVPDTGGNPRIINVPRSIVGFSTVHNDDHLGTVNVEWTSFADAAIQARGGENFRIDSLHTEGVRLGADGATFLSSTQNRFAVGSWTADDTIAMDAEITTRCSLVRSEHSAHRNPLWGPPEVVIDNFSPKNGILQTPDRVYWVEDAGNTGLCSVRFRGYSPRSDAGFRISGALCYPTNSPILAELGNVFPKSAIGYARAVNVNDTAVYNPIHLHRAARHRIDSIHLTDASISMSAALCGVYEDNTGSVLVTNSDSEAISTLTGSVQQTLALTLASPEVGKFRVGQLFPRLFLKLATGQSFTASLTAGASGARTSVGYGSGSTGPGRYLRTLKLTSAHNLRVGMRVTVASCGDAEYNGIVMVVDTPSSTEFSYYKFGDNAAETNVADTAFTVTIIPQVNVHVEGLRDFL